MLDEIGRGHVALVDERADQVARRSRYIRAASRCASFVAVADVFRTLEAEIRALVEPLSPRNLAERPIEEEFSSNEPPPEAVG
jgi:hypothetical protein